MQRAWGSVVDEAGKGRRRGPDGEKHCVPYSGFGMPTLLIGERGARF